MDDRNAFERQLADEIDYEVGPSHSVDALAITRRAMSRSRKWRFPRMSSAIKFAAGAAVLTVAGAAFLLVADGGVTPESDPVGPPGAEQPSPSPLMEREAGSTAASPAVYATGTIGWPPAEIVEPEVELVPGGNDERGLVLVEQPVEFDDPRLSGLLTTWGNGTTRELGDGRAWIESRAHRLVNEGGTWEGSGRLVRTSNDAPAVDEQSMVLIGQGAYEGYIAYLWLDPTPAGAAEWNGLILEAELPPLPDRAAAE